LRLSNAYAHAAQRRARDALRIGKVRERLHAANVVATAGDAQPSETTMRRPSCVAAAAAFLALSAGGAAAATGYTETDLNMRTGPGTGYSVITAIPGGAPVEVLNCSGGWCHVAWNGYDGYSSRAYLDIGADAYAAAPSAVVVAPPPTVYYGSGYYYGPGDRVIRRGVRTLRRELRQERREDRREARRDFRQDRRELRQDRRQDRRRDVRQDRRENRQEARQDRRQDRREARRDRRRD
jgi:uncharacterized protein YraI